MVEELKVINQCLAENFKTRRNALMRLLDLSTNEIELTKYEFALKLVESLESDSLLIIEGVANGYNKIQGQDKGQTERT